MLKKLKLTKKQTTFLVIVVVCLALPYLIGQNEYWVHVFITMGFYLIMASSLRLILTTGQLNLAHPTFAAFGAYTSTLLVMRLNQSFWVGLICGITIACLIALVLGFVVLRVKGIYFFLVTLCLLSLFVTVVGSYWIDLFGGHDGIMGIPAPSLFGISITGAVPLYYLCLFFVAIALLICWRVDRSRVGKAFYAIRDADNLCRSVGMNVMRWKVLAFTIGCGLAGMGGVFYAHYMSLITPEDFGIWPAIHYQIYAFVGGLGSVWGPLVGVLILGGLGDIFRGFGGYQMLIYSIFLILVMLFLPKGLIGIPERVRGLIRRGEKQ